MAEPDPKPDSPLEPPREAKEVYERWLAYLDDEITRHTAPRLRGEIVLNNLHQMLLGSPKGGRLNFNLNSELAFNVLQLSMDPKNVIMQAEYTDGLDAKQYAPRKPLIYFWQMFDRSAVGINQWLGFRFRAMLGKHIFKHIGKNVQIYDGVQILFGYNVSLEDECVIRRGAVLEDCTELTIEKGRTVGEYEIVHGKEEGCTDKA